ncbi:ankyrin repeat-containing domain protein [Nemania abortiva]|nr:ankyrin repeat-containing domain protein [Nemania abortiva]
MATQLPLDILWLIAEEIAVFRNLETALNFSLISRRTHDITYPLILKADALAPPTEPEPSDIHYPYEKPLSSLEFFIMSDNPTLVATYLDHTGMDINAEVHTRRKRKWSWGNRNILYTAARSGATSVVEFFFKAGGGFSEYRSSLYWAIDRNHFPMTKVLLEYQSLNDCDTDGRDLDRLISSSLADTGKRTAEMTKVLLPYWLNFNQYFVHERAIHLAAGFRPGRFSTSNFRERMDLLVQAGANIEALGDQRNEEYPVAGFESSFILHTPLNRACAGGEPYGIQVLLKLGAAAQGPVAQGAAAFDWFPKSDLRWPRRTTYYENDDDDDDDGNYDNYDNYDNQHSDLDRRMSRVPATPTPLYTLLSYQREQFSKYQELSLLLTSAKLLVDHGLGGPQGLFDRNQNMVVDLIFPCATMETDSSELWAILTGGGAFDVHRRNRFGQTSLSQLVSRCFGALTLKTSVNGEPLSFWKPNLVRALIEAGSDPNTVDGSGLTPLHWAVFYGDGDLVKLLLELGADPVKEVDGATAVHYAFGKPFARRGPVIRKVMARLRGLLVKELREYNRRSTIAELYNGRPYERGTYQAFVQYRKCKWHPLLSSCLDPFMRRERKHRKIVAARELRAFSVMALLSPFAECSKDENGHTPREIAQQAGILKEGESLRIRINDEIRQSLPQGLAYSEYLTYIRDEHLERRSGGSFDPLFSSSLCTFKGLRSRARCFQPLAHNAFMTELVETDEKGTTRYKVPSIACFR